MSHDPDCACCACCDCGYRKVLAGVPIVPPPFIGVEEARRRQATYEQKLRDRRT